MRRIFFLSVITLALSIHSTFSQVWEPLSCGVNGSVTSIISDSIHTRVFAGGGFDSAGCKNINSAAFWDGVEWHGTGQPYNAIFYDYCNYNGELYAAKNNAVVKLQDTSWVLVGSCTGDAHCLIVFDNKLIAGGAFSKISGTTVHYVAQYDGSTWSPIGNGFTGLDHDVESLAIYNGQLIAGGFFETEFGDTTQLNNIARWDGTKWQPLTGGISGGNVETMDTFQGELYASGVYMQYADTVACNKIAKWNGTIWQKVGTNEGVQSNELHAYKNKLYCTGSMTQDGVSFTIGFWNGVKWTDISGTYIGYSTYSLDFIQDTLYLGGLGIFPYNGDYVGTAMLDLNTIPTAIATIGVEKTPSIIVYPNPAEKSFTMMLQLPAGNTAVPVTWQLKNLYGTAIQSGKTTATAGSTYIPVELRTGIADGMYLLQLEAGNRSYYSSIIFNH